MPKPSVLCHSPIYINFCFPEHSRLFEFFISIFDLQVRNARDEGNFDSGIVDIKGNIIEQKGQPKVYLLPLFFNP